MKPKLALLLPLIITCCLSQTHADTLVTNFNSQNPLTFAYSGSTWATPVKQFDSFTSGGVSGQEVVPLGGGNPTVSVGAGSARFSLNLSSGNALRFTARLLPRNQASVIQVLLFDSDNTILRFDYPISDFNTSAFRSATDPFSTATIVQAGSIAGFNRSAVTLYEVQGNFFDAGAKAPLRRAIF